MSWAIWALGLLLTGCPQNVVGRAADARAPRSDATPSDGGLSDTRPDGGTMPTDADAPDTRTPDSGVALDAPDAPDPGDAGHASDTLDGGGPPAPRPPIRWQADGLSLGSRAGRALGCFGARGVVIGDSDGRLTRRETSGTWREQWRAPTPVQAIDGVPGATHYFVLTEGAAYRFEHGIDTPSETMSLLDYPQDVAASSADSGYLVSNLDVRGTLVPRLERLTLTGLVTVDAALQLPAVAAVWTAPPGARTELVVSGRGGLLEGPDTQLAAARVVWPPALSPGARATFDFLSVTETAGVRLSAGSGLAERRADGAWYVLRAEPGERLLSIAAVPTTGPGAGSSEPEAYAGGRLGPNGSFLRYYRGAVLPAGGDATTSIADLCFQSSTEAYAVGNVVGGTTGVVLRGTR
jgi:hypothetical protein